MFPAYRGEYQQNQLSCEFGPRWEGNQLADYVSKLVTACEDRAQELGFVGLARSWRRLRGPAVAGWPSSKQANHAGRHDGDDEKKEPRLVRK